MERRVDAGSIQALANYIRVGGKLGHTIAIYGDPDPQLPELHFSNNPHPFDYVIFILESKLNWASGLRLAHLLTIVPRSRRVILDADGMYNPIIDLDGYDCNPASERDRQRCVASYQALADLQPTLWPGESRVQPLLFYGYDAQVRAMQQINLATHHSQVVRLKELIEIIDA